MIVYNCIIVYDEGQGRFLFCKREKPPYKGLLNLVGGKVEDGEGSEAAAYRELFEETGVKKTDINLVHLMDMTYYSKDIILEIYGGILKHKVVLIEEKQSLFWIDEKENFFDNQRFAGDGNIGHMILQMGVSKQKME